jgi:hypothetical protein
MSRRTIISVITFSTFIVVVAIVIALAQGYRLDHATNQIYGTGIIVVETNPQGATVTLNGESRGTTNTTLSNLPAGTYKVKVAKDGYAAWETSVDLQQGKVINLLPLLVPINPSLSPVTSTPASNPVLSPDGQRLAYTVANSSNSSAGVWVLDLSSQPFNLSRKPQQIISDTAILHYSQSKLTWAPNNRELLATLDNGLSSNSYLLAVDGSHPPQDVSGTLGELQQDWHTDRAQALDELISDLPAQDKQLALDHATSLQWSPTNLKFLYVDEQDGQRTYSVYNKENHKAYQSFTVAKDKFAAVRWYADGQHLIVLEKDKAEATTGTISLMETDGSNKVPAFTGTLLGDVIYSYLNGAKLIILTSFNQQSDTYYLYSINLR